MNFKVVGASFCRISKFKNWKSAKSFKVTPREWEEYYNNVIANLYDIIDCTEPKKLRKHSKYYTVIAKTKYDIFKFKLEEAPDGL